MTRSCKGPIKDFSCVLYKPQELRRLFVDAIRGIINKETACSTQPRSQGVLSPRGEITVFTITAQILARSLANIIVNKRTDT